jgi:hypothetical protein
VFLATITVHQVLDPVDRLVEKVLQRLLFGPQIAQIVNQLLAIHLGLVHQQPLVAQFGIVTSTTVQASAGR